jgi:hypothetical protein
MTACVGSQSRTPTGNALFRSSPLMSVGSKRDSPLAYNSVRTGLRSNRLVCQDSLEMSHS